MKINAVYVRPDGSFQSQSTYDHTVPGCLQFDHGSHIREITLTFSDGGKAVYKRVD